MSDFVGYLVTNDKQLISLTESVYTFSHSEKFFLLFLVVIYREI